MSQLFFVPHGVEQCALLSDAQQFVGHGHVVRYRFLAIVEESVRSPDFTRHQIIETQHGHRTFKFQTLVLPALSEEDIDGVFLIKTQPEHATTQLSEQTYLHRDSLTLKLYWHYKIMSFK